MFPKTTPNLHLIQICFGTSIFNFHSISQKKLFIKQTKIFQKIIFLVIRDRFFPMKPKTMARIYIMHRFEKVQMTKREAKQELFGFGVVFHLDIYKYFQYFYVLCFKIVFR